MERIQVDFAMQRGHEMIIRRDPPFLRAELDETDLDMLQAVRPPGLLDIDWFEMDGSVSFRYAIGGRKMLPHRLIGATFGMHEFLALMLGIVEALDNSGHYLLRESCFLLEEKFLFIGSDWRDVALVYLPLREPPARRPIREELLGLAVRLMGKVDNPDGSVWQHMLRLLDEPEAPWSNIRVGLLQLMASGPQTAVAGQPEADDEHEGRIRHAVQPDMGMPRADGFRSGGAATPAAAEVRRPVHDQHHPADRTEASADRHPAAESAAPGGGGKIRFDPLGKLFGRKETGDVPPPETLMFDDREWAGTTGRIRDTGRARWMSVCGAVLAVALIWRYIYMPSPGTDRLLISIGATLLAAGGLILLWQRLASGNPKSADFGVSGAGGYPEGEDMAGRQPEPESGGHFDRFGFQAAAADSRTGEAEIRFPWLAEFTREERGEDRVPVTDGRLGAGNGAGSSGGAASGPAPGSSEAESEVTVRLDEDETVLLGREGEGRLWLVREYEGAHRRIPLEPGTHVIGRSEAHARIIDKAEGVSRAHLEIAFEGSEVRIKDLASRNGTLLGGEIMVPYKEYALGDGGVFRLAGPDGPKYTLRKSDSHGSMIHAIAHGQPAERPESGLQPLDASERMKNRI